ncbi:NACHT domain-containing protein 4 [Elsinoe fawcettii]|nr:NACHT domain-containing protein 4 [Elsinoe fawcettii]
METPAVGMAARERQNGDATFNNLGDVTNQAGHQTFHGSATFNTYHGSPSVLGGAALTEESAEAKRRRWLDILYFQEYENRQRTVPLRQGSTCEWLLRNQEFTQWQQVGDSSRDHDFLWLRGKPGTGKSTLMKYAHDYLRNTHSGKDVAAFFFHARGISLQHNLEGMYRSLLYQIYSMRPSVQTCLDDTPDSLSQDQNERLVVLEALFKRTLVALPGDPVFILIDALDECDDHMAQRIVDIASRHQWKGEDESFSCSWRICMASRHYPTVRSRNARMIIIEQEKQHRHDMATFVEANLELHDTHLMAQVSELMMSKANGVFLWIKLVVQMMNEDDANGVGSPIMTRLEEVPSELDELVSGIVKGRVPKSRKDHRQLQILLAWMLQAGVLLSPEVLYWAVLSDLPVKHLRKCQEDHPPDITKIHRFLLMASRGLIEVSEGPDDRGPIVQFIHETVRTYSRGYVRNTLGDMGEVHMRLAFACGRYLEACKFEDYFTQLSNMPLIRHNHDIAHKLLAKFPFLLYIHFYFPLHCWESCSKDSEVTYNTMVEFLTVFPISRWSLSPFLLADQSLNAKRFAFGVSAISMLAYWPNRSLDQANERKCTKNLFDALNSREQQRIVQILQIEREKIEKSL